MITDIAQLRQILRGIKQDFFPKDGWLELYHKSHNDNFEKMVKSFIANSESIDWHQPFSDTGGIYSYPIISINNSNAKILIVELTDSRDGTITPELNQEIKIQMGLLEKKNKENIFYNKVTADKSLRKSIIKNGNMFSANLIDLNELLGADENLVLCFVMIFNCDMKVLENINDDVMKIVRFPKQNLVYERTIRKSESLVRIIGKKVFKKQFYENSNLNFKIGYHSDGIINYFQITKDMEILPRYYLIYVYFDRRVLIKYEQNQYFNVDAMQLKCRDWSLQIFNNKINIVSVLLAHLIRDLPEEEYQHWMAYNILPAPVDFGITLGESDTSTKGIPHLPERNDHRFKWFLMHYYNSCKKINLNPILKKLNPIDQPYFNTLNLISENSQWHFDIQILNLSKLIIESVDLNELSKRGVDNNGKSKNMLKNYLTKGTAKNEFDYEKFLDNLYKLRHGATHRRSSKGKSDYFDGLNYFKKKYGDELINILDGIFNEASQLINLITKSDGIKTYQELHNNLSKNLSE